MLVISVRIRSIYIPNCQAKSLSFSKGKIPVLVSVEEWGFLYILLEIDKSSILKTHFDSIILFKLLQKKLI